MKIETDFDTCIVCMKNPPGDWEHVIPKCLGGMLQARVLCDECNHDFGSKLVSTLCLDSSIQYSFDVLRDRIPRIYRRSFKRQPLVGKGNDGSLVRVVETITGPKVLSGEGVDGTQILDTRDAEDALTRKLERMDIEPEEIAKYQDTFRKLPEDEHLQLPNGDIFVKREMPELQSEISTITADDRIYMLMAYEFLSLRIGKVIYEPYFDTLRDYIAGGPPTDIAVSTSLMSRGNVDTLHILRIFGDAEDMVIETRLFRWLIQQTRFEGIEYRGPNLVYMDNIENRRSLLSPSVEDAQEGRGYSPQFETE